MTEIARRSIAAKIGIVVAAFVLLACVLIGVGAYGMRANDRTVQGVFSEQAKALYLASVALEQSSHMHQRAFEVSVESDASKWTGLQRAVVDEIDGLLKTLTDMKPVLDQGDLELYGTLKPDVDQYREAEARAYALRSSGKLVEAEDQLQGEVTQIYARLNGHIQTLVSQQVRDMNDASNSVHDMSDRTLMGMIVTGVVGLTLTVAGALLLIRLQISRPIKSMTQVMSRLAAGDTAIAVPAIGRADEIGSMAAAVQSFKDAAIAKLALEHTAMETRRIAEVERARTEAERATVAEEQGAVVHGLATGLEQLAQGNLLFRLEQPFATHYEKLRADFNGAIVQLQQTMTVISGSTAAIQAGTAEISTASDDLSRRTEQQAASLEETAAALDEITATVRKTSEGSHHARTIVADATADAERSGSVVGRAVEAMSAIEQSSAKVSQIIGVIDEIAFQTNLLALNAGVEAARAGEAGRGFAVVASEVRALAQRSAEAAKEIKALISTSGQQVSEGVGLVSETGTALKRIVTHVAEINAVISDIATSTQEQATALQEVNTAINQMDQVTQQNAAMVEESTAASRNLATETEELARLVGQFHVGAAGGTAPVRRPAAPARPAPRLVTALKTSGQSAAARKPQAQEASWEEF